ncbi:triphosphoribosyl-dephospho-CoA synthase [Thiohalorhabdus methylotrophus]|uniref:Triphosphoribosyl-dephospho-CoA synthase n=1 Tax=Thiohalorhabdus methylotrophus TaxID=3242694 RepID=A0ABV4TV32_9GAMM
MTQLVSARRLLPLVRGAFLADVRWLKPGNVSRSSPGHGMTAVDFERSAGPAAEAVVAGSAGVGARVRAGVEATWQVVDCNTNLGILLLTAPLVEAALAPAASGDLRARLEGVLGGLTREDATEAFAAIRMASPGGLGSSARHDVADAPDCTLLEAMAEADDRDVIARQYTTGFSGLLDIGLDTLGEGLRRYGRRGPAVAELQLAYVSRFPDSHVRRKHGTLAAENLQERAGHVLRSVRSAHDSRARERVLAELDQALKEEGINPGTSADLTVATLIAFRLARIAERAGSTGGSTTP